jgi:hypothetical protein
MFEVLTNTKKGMQRPVRGLRIAKHKGGNIAIAIGPDLANQIGLTKGDRVSILWGSGQDFGLLRIQREPDGDFKLFTQRRGEGKTLRCSTNAKPSWVPNGPVFASDCEVVERDSRSVTVRLPADMVARKVAAPQARFSAIS